MALVKPTESDIAARRGIHFSEGGPTGLSDAWCEAKMPTAQIHELSSRLLSDPEFRRSFKSAPIVTVRESGLDLADDEIAALRQIDWANMSDEELIVRVRGAQARATTMTA